MTHDTEMLRAALIGWTKMRDDIDAKIAEIKQSIDPDARAAILEKKIKRFGKKLRAPFPEEPIKSKRPYRISPEGRARIVAGIQKRAAALREAKQPKPASETALYVDGRKVESLSDIISWTA